MDGHLRREPGMPMTRHSGRDGEEKEKSDFICNFDWTGDAEDVFQ